MTQNVRMTGRFVQPKLDRDFSAQPTMSTNALAPSHAFGVGEVTDMLLLGAVFLALNVLGAIVECFRSTRVPFRVQVEPGN